MRVKIAEIGAGQHPNEKLVQVITKDGSESLVVDRRAIHDNSLDVGYPVGEHNGHYLVELPRETSRGTWRVWVEKTIVFQG
jgi:hypothetical protein